MKLEARCEKIKLILSDVDGVLTGGQVTFDNQGIESKSFHIRDGMGIKLWHLAGFHFGLVTSRTSHIVKVRAAELGIDLLRQGFSEKLPATKDLSQQLGLSLDQVCYIGDDLQDMPAVKAVGLGVAVADAAPELLAAAHFVTKKSGGQGAVRELIELILKSKKRWDDVVGKFA